MKNGKAKKFARLVLVVGVIAVLGFRVSIEVVRAEQITLKYSAGTGFTPQDAIPESAAHWQRMFDKFAKEYPNIKLEYEALPGDPRTINTKMMVMAQAGNAPDVATVDAQYVGIMVANGLLRPLDDLWSVEERTDWAQQAVEVATYDGEIFGVPMYQAVRALYYRTDLLKDAGYTKGPETWHELITMGTKLTIPNKRWGVIFPAQTGIFAWLVYIGMVWGFEAKFVDETTKAPVFFQGENRIANIRVMNFLSDLVNEYKIAPPGVISLTDETMIPMIATDEAAMWMTSSSRYMQIKKIRPDMPPNLMAGKLPMPKPYVGRVAIGDWYETIMTQDPKKIEAAWKLITFLWSPESMGQWCAAAGRIPTRRSALEHAEIFRTEPIWTGFFDMASVGGHKRSTTAYDSIMQDALTGGLQRVIMGKISAEQAIDEAEEMVVAEWKRLSQK